jgi:hypothetical protein
VRWVWIGFGALTIPLVQGVHKCGRDRGRGDVDEGPCSASFGAGYTLC